jgi:hypothetical protein
MSGLEISNAAEAAQRGDHRVVVYAPYQDGARLGEILVHTGHVQTEDAVAAARVTPGILRPRLSKQLAQAVVAEIELQGTKAGILPESDVPILDEPETLYYLRCPLDGLEVVGLHGEMRRLVRWTDLCLISLGVMRQAQSGAAPQAQSHSAPPGAIFLWLVCERPPIIYQLRHNQMNYAYLGQRLTTSAAANFALLLDDLVQHATAAYLTPATQAFRAHELSGKFEFGSDDELRDYTAFHLVVSRQAARKPPAPSSP